MVQPEFAGIANDAEHHGLTGLALAVRHRLPAVVIQIAKALEAAHHPRAVLGFMFMHLGPALGSRDEQHQNGDQTAEQSAHCGLADQ